MECQQHGRADDYCQLGCDRPDGHDGPHYDTALRVTWSLSEPAPDDAEEPRW